LQRGLHARCPFHSSFAGSSCPASRKEENDGMVAGLFCTRSCYVGEMGEGGGRTVALGIGLGAWGMTLQSRGEPPSQSRLPCTRLISSFTLGPLDPHPSRSHGNVCQQVELTAHHISSSYHARTLIKDEQCVDERRACCSHGMSMCNITSLSGPSQAPLLTPREPSPTLSQGSTI
jgi:hypothetical protein